MSLAVVERHRTELTLLRDLAVQDLSQVVALIRGLDVVEARELLKDALPDLMDPFMGAASDAAAQLLDELYAIVGEAPPELARPSGLWTPERVDSLARWAVTPLVDDSLDSSVLTRLTGAAARGIFDASRLTVVDGVTRNSDGRRVYFQRVPRPGACAFCQMLASRPQYMAYKTEESAGAVAGRGSTRTGYDEFGNSLAGGRGGGIKARGTQELGEKYHDECHCVSVPMIGGAVSESLAESRAKYEDLYQQVVQTNERGVVDLKATLSAWRQEHGAH